MRHAHIWINHEKTNSDKYQGETETETFSVLLPCSGDAFEEMGLAEEVDPWFSLIPTPITKKKYKIKLKKKTAREGIMK